MQSDYIISDMGTMKSRKLLEEAKALKSKLRHLPEEKDFAKENYPLESLTEEIYGDIHRRISGMCAVGYTVPVPMMECFRTNAPYPEVDIYRLRGESWHHIWESEKTLYASSWQIGENTWLSSPYRAVLESAQHLHNERDPEWLLSVLVTYEFDAEEFAKTSEDINMQDGLRKLAAISTLYDAAFGESPEWVSKLQSYAAHIADSEILMRDQMSDISTEADGYDEDFGVIWNISKSETLNEIFT